MTDPERSLDEVSRLLKAEAKKKIVDYDSQRPRSMQTELGPSELADPCERKLAFKVSRAGSKNSGASRRAAIIGTAAHDMMERALADDPDWVVEKRVQIGGVTAGKSDALWLPFKELIYRESLPPIVRIVDGIVVDWKFPGDTTVTKVKRDGHPGVQYEGQAHSYAKGWAEKGYPVKYVAIAFLSKNMEDKDLIWIDYYDEEKAQKVLDRYVGIRDDVRAGRKPIDFPKTTGRNCIYCPYFGTRSDEETGRGCSGPVSLVLPKTRKETLDG